MYRNALMFRLQAAGISGSEFDTPEPYSLSSNGDTSLSENIFNISMTQIETIVEPDCLTDYVWWESVPFICIHFPILPISAS